MTGGELWAHDPRSRLPSRLTPQPLVLARPSLTELEPIRELVERHERATGSPRAATLLARWDKESGRWWRVVPRADVAGLEQENEGTGARDEEGAQAAGVGV
jgi:glutamate synthase domain-containing protein 3